jgi:PAS domain-containing protein
LAIDLSIEKLQEFCAVLNEFALPRAIVDFDRHSFVAWNPKFLEQTGFSEDEMKSSNPEELLVFGESWFPLSEEREGQTPARQDALLARIPRRDLPSGLRAKSLT